MTDNYTESLFRWACESYSLNMIVDENGIIRYIGRQHAAMYNGTPADFEGRLVTDVIPNTGVLRVLATGEAEHGELFVVAEGKEHEDVYAISRIPIRDHDGILRGVFTMALFSSLDTVDRLRKEVVNLRKANALYSKQLRGLTKHDFVLEDVAGISPSIMAVKEVSRPSAEMYSSGYTKESLTVQMQSARRPARAAVQYRAADSISTPRTPIFAQSMPDPASS